MKSSGRLWRNYLDFKVGGLTQVELDAQPVAKEVYLSLSLVVAATAMKEFATLERDGEYSFNAVIAPLQDKRLSQELLKSFKHLLKDLTATCRTAQKNKVVLAPHFSSLNTGAGY